jgi:UTP--glucose-1-phosphate uridylyltransferase
MNGDFDPKFKPFADKMLAEKLPQPAINTFRYYYQLLVEGKQGMVTRQEIDPVPDVPGDNTLDGMETPGAAALPHTVVIKLNGGLGTSMGMTRAKSLLPVKNDLTFLDIIARQILKLRQDHGCSVPLLFMNSFSTHTDTLRYLKKYPELANGLPLDFMQHKIPKITAAGLTPAVWPDNPELEWCPPGHGDLYTALVTSGLLAMLRAKGYRYAFVSNSDNLGAMLDLRILGYFAQQKLPFMMEVTTRTEADKKGGHLAQLKNGRLTLRETAQCPDDEKKEFEDVSLYKYFNTNNLWVDLDALAAELDKNNQVMPLAMIRNSKTVDPRDKKSPKVIQLETAMGAAISLFAGARALEVPRTRFAPVKKCSDLLALWSDAYALTGDFQVVTDPGRTQPPVVVELDAQYYALIDDLTKRFPAGAPALRECGKLVVEGDVTFGKDVVIKGDVKIINPTGMPKQIADGMTLTTDWILS